MALPFVSMVCRTFGAMLVMYAAAVPMPAIAQSGLEAQRAAVFEQMFNDPANPDLMLAYASLSAEMGDFETVAATLERLVALQPENAAARLQLAQAYSAIGADPLAQYHLSILTGAGELPPEAAARVDAVQSAAADRSAASQFSGRVSLGASHQAEAGETAAIGVLSLDWRVDMGGAHDQDWRTQLALSAFAAGDGGAGDRQVFRLRTGPELRITGETQGPLLQPYLQFEARRDSAGSDLNQLGLGFAYHTDWSPSTAGFADLSLSRADNLTSGEDVTIADLQIGAAHTLGSATALRLSAGLRREDGTTEDRDSLGARLNIGHQFDAPFGFDGQPWTLLGGLSAERTDVSGGTSPREERQYGLNLLLRGYVSDAVFWDMGVSRTLREADVTGFDSSETTASLRLGWEF